ncbi:hypothetical protein VNO80_04089 [Phaseolus coccineus]|uniref:Uncharacterized protein n=1 Tax=Phaseolus coccineus TaxID=3886 RepID=A0AAN9NXA1_PHACN
MISLRGLFNLESKLMIVRLQLPQPVYDKFVFNGIRGGHIVALDIVHLDIGFGVLHVGPGQGSATKPTTIWASRSSSTGPTQITTGLEMLPFVITVATLGFVCVSSSSTLNMQLLWIGD